ncbi:hypothetical protein CN633_32040, partial [Bacillus toyonensis]
ILHAARIGGARLGAGGEIQRIVDRGVIDRGTHATLLVLGPAHAAGQAEGVGQAVGALAEQGEGFRSGLLREAEDIAALALLE